MPTAGEVRWRTQPQQQPQGTSPENGDLNESVPEVDEDNHNRAVDT